ncbi:MULTISPECIES: MFS transporter [Micromonospora]|uniref:MFS transporter n=1 Tax=Micromonospora solifontis TaxID=2487138 RepID=A0ABX9WD23_9ACTN|nr:MULTISPECIES: MFS transporter [Micromonospora]NES16464.1 MFS transporter [Micromonospora sp. PPF5-17B]NES39259.1 MFS transporter [Micromonospora solifontis]NES58152.1 MFS transporter [Micromonospora sp. PPF5-6]RNL89799.1 MFS transporter [Micromonospora solifontis]
MSWGTTRVLGNRDASRYLVAVLVSGFGTAAMLLVAGIWVKDLTGSSSLAGLVTLGLWGPTLVGPLIGVLVDRFRRRPLLIVLHVAMAALLPVLLLVDTTAEVWLIFAVTVGYGISFVLIDSAEAALVPSVVPGELLGDFNGLRMTVNEGMKLLAPLAGAGLFAAYGGHPVVLLDTATFALAALVLALLRVREQPPPPPDPWARQLADGLGHLRRHAALRHLVRCAGAAMLLIGINGALAYAVVDAGLHRPPEFNGVLGTVQGVGSLVGGLAAGALLRRLGDRRVTAVAVALLAAGLALRAVPALAPVVAGTLAVGIGAPLVLITVWTAVQRETPDTLVGRVSATVNTLTFGPGTLAVLAGAGVLVLLDHRVIQLVAAAGALLLAGWALRGGRGTPPGAVGPVPPGEAAPAGPVPAPGAGDRG